MFSEFKKFAVKGNIMDMAIGIIIGGAFGKIVSSLVGDIIMPIISLLTGKIDFQNLFIALDGKTYQTLAAAQEAGVATVNYGTFISIVIDFVIIAFSIFIVMRKINDLKKKEEPAPEPAPVTKTCPFCQSEIHIDAKRCPNCTSQLEDNN